MRSASWKTLGAAGLVVVGLVAVVLSFTFPTRVCAVTQSGETISGTCSGGSDWLLAASVAVLAFGVVSTLGGGWGVRRWAGDAGAYSRIVSGGVLAVIGALVGYSFGGWVWNLLTSDPWATEGMPLYSWVVLVGVAGAGLALAAFGGRLVVGGVRSVLGGA